MDTTDQEDPVESAILQWKQEKPDLDFSYMLLTGRLQRVHAAWKQLAKEYLASYEINLPEFDVIATLRRSGPPYALSPTSLYRSSMLSSGAMTNRIDRIEALGLVERQKDPKDRRSLLVKLTDAGLDLTEKMLPGYVKKMDLLSESLSKEDKKRLSDLLKKLQ